METEKEREREKGKKWNVRQLQPKKNKQSFDLFLFLHLLIQPNDFWKHQLTQWGSDLLPGRATEKFQLVCKLH